MKYKNIFISFALLFCLGFLIYKVDSRSDTKINICGRNLYVDISDSTLERKQGLSGREYIGESEGMLFMFERPQIAGFWMKDMLFPIDIIWINEDMEIVGVEREVSPETFPKVFYSGVPIKYVLEANSGFFALNKCSISDKLEVF